MVYIRKPTKPTFKNWMPSAKYDMYVSGGGMDVSLDDIPETDAMEEILDRLRGLDTNCDTGIAHTVGLSLFSSMGFPADECVIWIHRRKSEEFRGILQEIENQRYVDLKEERREEIDHPVMVAEALAQWEADVLAWRNLPNNRYVRA